MNDLIFYIKNAPIIKNIITFNLTKILKKKLTIKIRLNIYVNLKQLQTKSN